MKLFDRIPILTLYDLSIFHLGTITAIEDHFFARILLAGFGGHHIITIDCSSIIGYSLSISFL